MKINKYKYKNHKKPVDSNGFDHGYHELYHSRYKKSLFFRGKFKHDVNVGYQEQHYRFSIKITNFFII
jgi:hypothetical protein